jgi:phosphoribosylformimino-5-aminoimidazole carboxamide ribotide isomerase
VLENIDMEIIPAIDLKDGKCVRLLQGRDDATTQYSGDPVAVAREWVQQGAKRLHVVNLDGAFGRSSGHLDILRAIARDTGVLVEYGGGLRSIESMNEAFEAGAGKIVIGTVAVSNPAVMREATGLFGAGKVIIALDAVRGKIATHGWTQLSSLSVVELARTLEDGGVEEVLYTDVERDGMMAGPDIATLSDLASIGISIIVSGGIATIDDVRALVGLRLSNIIGVIIGKALYEKRLSLSSAIAASA